ILTSEGSPITTVPVDGAIQEYTLETSGRSAESETSGVKTNIVPKEGGNTFHGSFFANFANASMESNNYTDALKNKGLKSPNSAKEIWAVNPAFGGPLI